jgi:hypothetical protein
MPSSKDIDKFSILELEIWNQVEGRTLSQGGGANLAWVGRLRRAEVKAGTARGVGDGLAWAGRGGGGRWRFCS